MEWLCFRNSATYNETCNLKKLYAVLTRNALIRKKGVSTDYPPNSSVVYAYRWPTEDTKIHIVLEGGTPISKRSIHKRCLCLGLALTLLIGLVATRIITSLYGSHKQLTRNYSAY